MSAKPLSSKVRDVVFGILSFILSLLFTLLSFGLVIQSTVFNKNAWIDSMNRTEYFVDKTAEVKDQLKDLTYASGLKKDFFDSVVNEIMVTDDTYTYIDNYFNGSSKFIDADTFKQKMTVELEKYIEQTNSKNVSEAQIKGLINEATKVYSANVSIIGLASASVYFLAIKKVLPVILLCGFLLALGLTAVLFFANKWKHRSAKFIYYATAGAFLSNLALAMFISINGGVKKINLESRSLYNFAVGFVNSINMIYWLCAAFFLLLSVALFFLYRKLFFKVSKHGGA